MTTPTQTELEARIEEAVEHGIDSFWKCVADEFPLATSGDFDPMYAGFMYSEATKWVRHWLSLNGKEIYV